MTFLLPVDKLIQSPLKNSYFRPQISSNVNLLAILARFLFVSHPFGSLLGVFGRSNPLDKIIQALTALR